MTDPLTEFSAYENFDEASKAVLSFLKHRLGFQLWMTTRTLEPDWIVLNSEDDGYGVAPGTVFQWADSFCSRMVKGEGPNIAPVSGEVEAYSLAPIGKQVDIGAYIGVPIPLEEGRLFGTLCAIDPDMKSTALQDELPLIRIFANLLGTLVSHELKALAQARAMEVLQADAEADHLTGLLNRKGWEQRTAQEASRAQRYGSPISVMILDLDDLKMVNDRYGHDAGDQLLKSAVDCLKSSVRSTDIVARIGGDEFAILAIEANSQAAEILFDTMLSEFRQRAISVSIGWATHNLAVPLADTVRMADKAMYRMKNGHRTKR